jgi:ABC-type transport system involved in multi-copper enzyme maturation permease subunit
MHTLRRLWTFVHFTLTEHIRSGRILVELVGTVAFWTVFFRDRGLAPLTLDVFFSLSSIFTLLLTFYTSSALLGLGERPQGYLMLTRPLGRRGYLLGLYLVALIVGLLMFGLLTLLTLIFNRPLDFAVGEFAKGTAPLVLNIALVAALMTLISSLVLSNSLRLLVLALLAVALYSQTWHLSSVFRFIEPVQSALSWLIYPALRAFRLASTRAFGPTDVYVLLAQIALTLLLLGLALFSFSRRDVILRER